MQYQGVSMCFDLSNQTFYRRFVNKSLLKCVNIWFTTSICAAFAKKNTSKWDAKMWNLVGNSYISTPEYTKRQIVYSNLQNNRSTPWDKLTLWNVGNR